MVIYHQRRVFVDILQEEEDGDDVRFNWVVGGGGSGKEMV